MMSSLLENPGRTLPLLVALGTLLFSTLVVAASESVDTGQERSWLGPDGQFLPFTSHEEALEFLRAAEVIASKPIPTGVTNPKKLLLEHDGIQAHAVFRTYHREQRNMRTGNGSVIRFFRDSHINEVAAYELSRLLDFEVVPPAIERRIRTQRGSLQLWIEGAKTEKRRREMGLAPPDRQRWNLQERTMIVFDNLIHNIDRNQGNILITHDWSLWLIDHTRAFSRNWNLTKRAQILQCGRQLWQALLGLDEEVVRRRLSPYMGSLETAALLQRRDEIIAILQQRIAEHGEAAVIFNLDF